MLLEQSSRVLREEHLRRVLDGIRGSYLMNIIRLKYWNYVVWVGFGLLWFLQGAYGMSASPSKGGPVLYIVNNTKSKLYVRDIPTQSHGKEGPVIYYTPTNFNPLGPSQQISNDFPFDQWFGHPGQASGKIKLVSDDLNDVNRWDDPLDIDIREGGISQETFIPSADRDSVNKRERREIQYTVVWNGNGWKVILDERRGN